ncbi:MAG: cyclic nucleotide-binding domain-containing protein [Deltaproteobacteria bacterium]|nr:cyclic nucleotide-binding domain-containing protein [Deltaproteobacteria bacterium]MBW1911623.1 cyclic nucleotide-binding domain-containing protein [Deltaproteobacteria bacterium]
MAKFEVSFKTDSIIFEEGDVEDTMFFIKDGKVEISRTLGNAKQVIALLGPNDFFGEMALLSKSPRSATATAVNVTTAIVFNRKQFLSLLKTKGEIALKIIDVLILRLKESNDTIRKLIQKNQKALVFDTLSKWLQVKETDTDIQAASEWVSTQLGMKVRETEAAIRNLMMMNLVFLTDNRISINQDETAEKLKKLVEQ